MRGIDTQVRKNRQQVHLIYSCTNLRGNQEGPEQFLQSSSAQPDDKADDQAANRQHDDRNKSHHIDSTGAEKERKIRTAPL